MKQFYFHYLLIITSCFLLLCGCAPSKKLEKGKYLLNSNYVRTGNYKLSRDELNSYIKPKPNRKILGLLKLNYTIYRIADRGKENRWKKWLKTTLGESPVLLDTNAVKNSVKQLRLYLNSKGYFNSIITSKIKYKRQKANVFYNIKTPKPYTFRKVTYSSPDSLILKFLKADSSNSLIKEKYTYDVDVIEHERERISANLKNNGYYKFSKEYVNFRIDSTLGLRKMDVDINVKPALEKSKEKPDSTIFSEHKRYKIRNLYICPDYSVLKKDTSKFDTIVFKITQKNFSNLPLSYYILYRNKLKYKPKTLTQTVFMKTNTYYALGDVNETYTSLSALQNFRFININFSENNNLSDSNLLDCKINLTRLPKQSFTITTEGTNSGGDLGVAVALAYQNINLFKGAEIFSLKPKLALEVQKTLGTTQTQNIIASYLPFNTIETGVEANLEIPKYLLPFPQENFAQYHRPKTEINMSINYQRRTDFSRLISNISFGYKWKENNQVTQILTPIDISSVNIKMDSAFAAVISQFNDKFFQNSYSNHLTAGLKYSFIYNTQELNKKVDFTFFRINIKTAGNLLRVIDEKIWQPILHPDENFAYYTVLNNRYAQFIRTDAEYRYYRIINDLNTVVYRGAVGFGIPYMNLTSLPFEESFFSGGANGVRAWEIRSLGPGAYYDKTGTKFDKTGDIKLEANVEYRFPIYKLFKGVVFIDAGNIWMKDKNPAFPGGDFEINRFYKEIALGTGLGARFDFSFFIIRMDLAMPLKDPSKPEGHRWELNHSKLKDFVLNLGIGYPF